MKKMFIYHTLILGVFGVLFTSCGTVDKSLYVKSKDGSNKITLSLNKEGELNYKVTHGDKVLISDSSLGLKCDDQNFTSELSIVNISPLVERREQYELKVGNIKKIDHILKSKSITLKNSVGDLIIVDLIAGEEGVAFRYRFPEIGQSRIIKDEITAFHIEKNAKGWLMPYNKAGDYTPGYEDFYFNISSGDPINNPRNPSIGWCMPALFNVNDKKKLDSYR